MFHVHNSGWLSQDWDPALPTPDLAAVSFSSPRFVFTREESKSLNDFIILWLSLFTI